MTSLQFREQLRLSHIEVNNGIEKLLQMKGAVEGYKLKIKVLEIESNSLESNYKKKISDSQRERKKLHANLKAETFAKDLAGIYCVYMTQRVRFPPPPRSLFDISLLPRLAPPETVDRHFKSIEDLPSMPPRKRRKRRIFQGAG